MTEQRLEISTEDDIPAWLGAFALGGTIAASSMAVADKFPIIGGVGIGVGGLLMAGSVYYGERYGSEEAPSAAGRNRQNTL